MARNNKACLGCGHEIEPHVKRTSPGEEAVDIRIGVVIDPQRRGPGRPPRDPVTFKAKSQWGRMHLQCFLRSVSSHGDVLREMGLV